MVYERRKAFTRLPWDEDEEKLLLQLAGRNFTYKDILEEYFPHRTMASIKNKLRKLRKKLRLYNNTHRELKERMNKGWIKYAFFHKRRPLKVLDGYAGAGDSFISYLSFSREAYACELNGTRFEELVENVLQSTQGKIVYDHKIRDLRLIQIKSLKKNIVCVRGDVEKLASLLYVLGHRFDFVDLDPCGSCMFTLPLTVKIIKNGYLAVTYGQLQLARLKRIDVLRKECPWINEKMDMYETLTSLVKWTIYEGVRAQNYTDTKLICLKELVSLSPTAWNRSVIRGFFEIRPSPALADSLNHFEKEKSKVEFLVRNVRYGLRDTCYQ